MGDAMLEKDRQVDYQKFNYRLHVLSFSLSVTFSLGMKNILFLLESSLLLMDKVECFEKFKNVGGME